VIKQIVIVSDGAAVHKILPDKVNDYVYSPNVQVTWNSCRIKYYLQIMPDNNVANPAAGYGYDKVLLEWDPMTKQITRLGSYTASRTWRRAGRRISTSFSIEITANEGPGRYQVRALVVCLP
jgi:hypothetical protein